MAQECTIARPRTGDTYFMFHILYLQDGSPHPDGWVFGTASQRRHDKANWEALVPGSKWKVFLDIYPWTTTDVKPRTFDYRKFDRNPDRGKSELRGSFSDQVDKAVHELIRIYEVDASLQGDTHRRGLMYKCVDVIVYPDEDLDAQVANTFSELYAMGIGPRDLILKYMGCKPVASQKSRRRSRPRSRNSIRSRRKRRSTSNRRKKRKNARRRKSKKAT